MRHSSCWFHELAFLALTGCAASPEGTTTLQPSNLLAGGGTASVCLPTNSGDLFIEGIQNPTIYHQVVGIQFNAVNYVYSTCGGIYSVTPGGYSVFNNWTVADSRIATPGTKTTAAGQGWAFTGVSSGFTSLRVDCVSGDPSYGTCGTKVVLLDIGSPSSVSVSGPASIYVGEDYNFVATATDQYGTTVTRTGTAVWSSSNPSAANLISTARVHAYAQGTTTLTANLYGVAGTKALQVKGVQSISFSPASPVVTAGYSSYLAANVLDQFGQPYGGTTPVTWTSSNSSIVQAVSPTNTNSPPGGPLGVASTTLTGVAPGTANITASAQGVQNVVQVQVYAPLSVTISGKASIRPNVTCSYASTVTDGVPPYSYIWSGMPGYPNNSDTFLVNSYGLTGTYTLSVQITDSRGVVGFGTKSVNVTSSASICTS